MMNNSISLKSVIIVLFTSIFLQGCAFDLVQTQWDSTFPPGPCRELYTTNYYYKVNDFSPSDAFAVAKEDQSIVCAFAVNGDQSYGEPISISQRAIYRCENERRGTEIRTPCSLFTENFTIVWNPPPPPLPPPPTQDPQIKIVDGVSIDDAKEKCADLGFKRGTPKFGECVLKLTR